MRWCDMVATWLPAFSYLQKRHVRLSTILVLHDVPFCSVYISCVPSKLYRRWLKRRHGSPDHIVQRCSSRAPISRSVFLVVLLDFTTSRLYLAPAPPVDHVCFHITISNDQGASIYDILYLNFKSLTMPSHLYTPKISFHSNRKSHSRSPNTKAYRPDSPNQTISTRPSPAPWADTPYQLIRAPPKKEMVYLTAIVEVPEE